MKSLMRLSSQKSKHRMSACSIRLCNLVTSQRLAVGAPLKSRGCLCTETFSRGKPKAVFQSLRSLCLILFSFLGCFICFLGFFFSFVCFLNINGHLYCESGFCCLVKKTVGFSQRLLSPFFFSVQLFPSTVYCMHFFPPSIHLHKIYSTPVRSLSPYSWDKLSSLKTYSMRRQYLQSRRNPLPYFPFPWPGWCFDLLSVGDSS